LERLRVLDPKDGRSHRAHLRYEAQTGGHLGQPAADALAVQGEDRLGGRCPEPCPELDHDCRPWAWEDEMALEVVGRELSQVSPQRAARRIAQAEPDSALLVENERRVAGPA